MQQKIIKTGHSLCITIPADFAKILGLKPGQTVETKVSLIEGSLTHSFTSAGQMSLLKKTQ